MPRKGKDKAVSEVEAAQLVTWRYLVRNPYFQSDMRNLRESMIDGPAGPSEFMSECETVADKWGLLRIPPSAIIYWPGENLNRDEVRDSEHYGSDFGVLYSPVASTELREDRFLHLIVDLEQPADVLLPLFQEELRQQTEKRSRRRRRLDKADFYLEVYDRAKEGATFVEIASELDRKPKTVISAYLTASSNIFGPAPAPKKARLSLAYFDPSTHSVSSCATCRNAKTAEEMCNDVRQYVSQDHKAQREITGHDTTR